MTSRGDDLASVDVCEPDALPTPLPSALLVVCCSQHTQSAKSRLSLLPSTRTQTRFIHASRLHIVMLTALHSHVRVAHPHGKLIVQRAASLPLPARHTKLWAPAPSQRLLKLKSVSASVPSNSVTEPVADPAMMAIRVDNLSWAGCGTRWIR